MSDTVLYRKYRPQSFKDVVGQDHIISVLEGSIKQGSIAHAYLFAGSRGIGKTSIARIFAREIGTSANDLYEIDAASNRGIDDIREIREAVNTLPFESKYKVYIIDEVHMLTKEAFNALLKTLEEPPAHVVFILATTETEKLPETVVSRCRVFTFKKPTQKILKDTVLDISTQEGVTLEPASAELIALLGDGSFRDTLGMLQKVLGSTKAKKISHAEVEKITGAPKSAIINDFISALAHKDAKQGIRALEQAADHNLDMSLFLKLVLQKVRAALLLRIAPDTLPHFEQEFSHEDLSFVKDLAAKETSLSSKVVLELLKAEELNRISPLPQLPLELALLAITG